MAVGYRSVASASRLSCFFAIALYDGCVVFFVHVLPCLRLREPRKPVCELESLEAS